MINKISLLLLIVYFSCSSFATEIFNNGKAPILNIGTAIRAEDTIAGYPILLNGGNWLYGSSSISESTGRAVPIKMAYLDLFQKEGNNVIALMKVVANLGNNNGAFWSGEPCTQNHLVVVNKANGREDHCLTIDPVQVNLDNVQTTLLEIRVTNNASAGRYYYNSIALNLNMLGVKGTSVSDWAPESLRANQYRKAFLDKVTLWAVKLLDASIKLTDYSKPQDVFNNIPEIKTLLTVPIELKYEKLSIGFLSAIEDLNQRQDYKALAFTMVSPVSTPYKTSWDMPNQDDADKKALAACQASGSNPNRQCVLYKSGMSISDMVKIMTNSTELPR